MKEITVHIEIPMDSNIKYEYDRKNNQLVVDRILRKGYKYPANYGFIEETLDWDGDELDVLIYSGETFVPGSTLKAIIIGAMKMIDDGETDTKLIAVHKDDYKLENIRDLKDIPKKWLMKVENFFSTYKNWKKPGITSISGFEDAGWAIKEYNECIGLMKDYGFMDKKEFISKMKVQRPEKYTK